VEEKAGGGRIELGCEKNRLGGMVKSIAILKVALKENS